VTLNIGFGEQTPEEHLGVIAWFREWLARHDDLYLIVASPADLDRAATSGRMAVMFDIEGARGIGDRLDLIGHYRALGVIWMLVAYNRANLAGGGCLDPVDAGLSAFGRAMIAEMNRVGMMVCLSHCGERTAYEALDVSTKPVIVSHSNCRALFDHPRNVSDDLIRACAAQGGVIGINGLGDFLAPSGADLVAAVVAHVDHVVQLVGPEHVGISLDYVWDQDELRAFLETMPDLFPDGFPDPLPLVAPEAWPAIIDGLLARGYDERALALVAGGSWRRVAAENWREG
jgi:membrane dipeptidase